MAGLTMTTLVKKMVEETDLSDAQARAAIKGFVSCVQEILSEENGFVTVTGLGTFRAFMKGDRYSRDPGTGKQVYVEPYLKATFRASLLMKDIINKRR